MNAYHRAPLKDGSATLTCCCSCIGCRKSTRVQRGQQDLGECVIDAVRHLAASEGRGAGLCLEKRDRHLLVKETAELTARYLADQGKVEPARLSAPLQAPAPLRSPLPPGMVYCRCGHRPHPEGKECPDCVA